MKTTVKQLATITFISLLLMVLNVKAEGTESTALKNENVETTLEMENWMTDSSIWKTEATFFYISPESETELGLDEWMINSATWSTGFQFNEETESGMELEDWMVNDSNWFVIPQEKESALQLEAWMTNETYWK